MHKPCLQFCIPISEPPTHINNSKKPKSQLWMGRLSPSFDQQATLSSKSLSPNIRCGGVSALAENTFSFQQVSPPRQRHLVLMRCYLLTIQVTHERIAVRSMLYIHNSKKPRFKLWTGRSLPWWRTPAAFRRCLCQDKGIKCS